MTDRETIAVYDARAGEYAQLDTTGAASESLTAFMALLPAGGRVLDLGCGPGTSARYMAQAGLVVDAMDASAEMVALAARIDGVTAWQASFDDLEAEGVYDAIWANFSLLHAPRADLPRHLSAIHRALKPGGVVHIAVKEGTGEARDRLGRRYAYYTLPEMTDLLGAAGFVPGAVRQGRDRGLDGAIAPWFSVTAHA